MRTSNSSKLTIPEAFFLSEIPEKRYQKILILNGEKKVNFSQNTRKNFQNYDLLKICKIKKDNPQKNDAILKFLIELETEGLKYDLIIISNWLYFSYIGSSNLLIYQIIKKLLKDNAVLMTIHENEKYISRFPFFILSEHYFDFDGKNYMTETYIK